MYQTAGSGASPDLPSLQLRLVEALDPGKIVFERAPESQFARRPAHGGPPIALEHPRQVGRQLLDAVQADPGLEITVDLERLTVEALAIGLQAPFPLDPATRERFLQGLDDIGITLRHADEISSFEQQRPDWMPAVDISETADAYRIKADLPEVRKEDVKVSLEDSTLTIQGERKQEEERKGVRFHRIERSYGSFMRSFTLPEDADEAKISAEYKDGVLHVHLPKCEKPKPKSIEVRVT